MKAISLLFALVICMDAGISPASAGASPGFYPGGAEPWISDPAAFRAFLIRHKAKIDEINTLISKFKSEPRLHSCIGASVADCVASLALVFPVNTMFAPGAPSLNAPLDDEDVDVNGKRITAKTLSVILGPADAANPMLAMLNVDEKGRVETLYVVLPADPLMAGTAAEYDRTRIYEALAATMPGSCDLPDRQKVYQLVENELKPRSVPGTNVGDSAEGLKEASWEQTNGSLCGLPINLRTEVSSAVDRVTSENPHGMSKSTTLAIGAPAGSR